MSSRALKKLHGSDELSIAGLVDVESDCEDELDPLQIPAECSQDGATDSRHVLNRFELLNDIDDDDADSSKSEPDVDLAEKQSQAKVTAVKDAAQTKPKSKKKKKKKKNHKESSSLESKLENEDEVDASIRQVQEILGASDMSLEMPLTFIGDLHVTKEMRSLLTVEHRYLNPDSEMKRKFGAKVVQTDKSKRRNRRFQRTSWLARPKDSWPQFSKSGLSMQLLDTKQGAQYFTFIHSKDYQTAQFQFYDAVESHQPDNIVQVLNLQPYHLDALLQLSEVFKINEDIQMAAELLERALFCCENAFHPVFNITQGNCRLDYRRPENRSFYIAIFKHILFVGQRGCYRTALEFCKLLLSLDPDGDPLCVLLMIDYYAVKSEQYEYLIRMYMEWEAHRNLSQLPNFAFSVPLATFYQRLLEGKTTHDADEMLQEALLQFPALLMPLLNKCNVVPDTDVTRHELFGLKSEASDPEALRQLLSLYVGRSHGLWKDAAVVTWLENNVRSVMARASSNDSLVRDYRQKKQSRYRGTPRNILRHMLMSEIPDATASLPRDMANTPFMSYDPLPPTDSIVSYKRPARDPKPEEGYGSLGMFFRSMLPNFNAEDLVPAHGEVAEAAGAAGGLQGQQELRQGFGNLMHALRDLLNQIQPVPPPATEQANGTEDGDSNDEWND
ncbi:PREDICTED: transcription factor 25-like [Priapulus caudatus]|uniref:Transcription factor 25-like n=1 Tax=Priapulus caudatus TaxID=37621 RepID=A0ABM1DPN2_PRICU|nr:PREDICTED: transcription factor 25-like [Priapulus caudatus]